MAARIIAQIIVVGGSVLLRGFVQAYREALQNAPKGAAGARAATQRVRGKMDPDMASEILALSKSSGLKEIDERFLKMYQANDPSKGGSQYLQYKIFSARNALVEAALERGERFPEEAQSSSSGGAAAGDAGSENQEKGTGR
ncbi:Mitochondrial import inner membrane translocase subunit tim16 [Porphyridium purpureum]|uniref:Mitochondrial import inner membrane translocase subunit tim16 n=1 Tax=Porphyridium purpureum TaxID=35688 RepID=A0A5J4Z7Y3_PORPP|nr:Mitochondrial import inner membrane translocase subunit tim16 [Porphyridium purpureum]|eukprot:POR3540..scf295_1